MKMKENNSRGVKLLFSNEKKKKEKMNKLVALKKVSDPALHK
jgi:hypothetical protein